MNTTLHRTLRVAAIISTALALSLGTTQVVSANGIPNHKPSNEKRLF